MSYYFAGGDWRKIECKRFDLPSSSTGEKWIGTIPRQEDGLWPRSGSEAVCLRAMAEEVSTGRRIESVIKIFMRDLAGRPARQTFLVRQKLAKQYPWLFQCVPYSSFNGAIDGVPVIGHLSRYVGDGKGDAPEDFDRLKQRNIYGQFSRDQRRHFVADIATAVMVLEAKGIAHGDLSDGNVLIGPIAELGRHGLVLCDFDGFEHLAAPRLPRKRRPLGSVGYVPPFMIDRLQADTARADDTIHIAGDRFALGALACELVCWAESTAALLGNRDRLLDTDATLGLRDGGWSCPEAVSATWPEGFALLARAARATDWKDLPSPGDWLRALGLPPSIDNVPFSHPPFLRCRRAGQAVEDGWRQYVLKQAKGSMHPIGTGLAGISYARDEGCLSIDLPAGEVVMVGPLGRSMKRVVGPAALRVGPETRLIVGGMELEIHDRACA